MPVRLPDGLDPVLGVFLANVETATNVVIDAAPRLGERVAVFGQGVVGLLITQLLRLTGVSQIIVVEPVAARRALACQVGADVALDASDGDVARALRELTDGVGVDLAIEASGSAAALDPGAGRTGVRRHVRRVLLVRHQAGRAACSAAPSTVAGCASSARRSRRSTQLCSRAGRTRDGWRSRATCCQAWSSSSLISHRIPFERAAEAYALVDQRADQTVQVVLTYP